MKIQGEDELEPLRIALICEACTYEAGVISLWYGLQDLLEHCRKYHWMKVGMASNGQPIYGCSHCEKRFQLSHSPIVDFAFNLFCSWPCVGSAYDARLKTHETIAVLSQERRDEEYVRKSLGVET